MGDEEYTIALLAIGSLLDDIDLGSGVCCLLICLIECHLQSRVDVALKSLLEDRVLLLLDLILRLVDFLSQVIGVVHDFLEVFSKVSHAGFWSVSFLKLSHAGLSKDALNCRHPDGICYKQR